MGSYGDTTTATVFYAGTVATVGALHGWLWWHAMRADLIDADVTDAYRRHSLARGIVMPLFFLVSIPVAFVYSFFVEHYVSGITGSVKG